MKFAESWLREWIDPPITTEELAHRLTMAGHEVDGVELEGRGLDGIVVAEVIEVRRHPDADRLSVCRVSPGNGDVLEVVCGAPNVHAGMKTPLAVPGITLPNGLKLRRSKIRGIVSNGMLCSAAELGLGDEADGIMELPEAATAGMPLTECLRLPDAVIDIDLTPNRGDCFSILGLARDVAAVTDRQLHGPAMAAIEPSIGDVQPVELIEPASCPRFAGRVVRGIDPAARSPVWMTERLRRSGIRSIHPVVDITNYVMLELGQPLHAYDLGKIRGAIRPRLARKGESVVLLDGRKVDLNDDTVVITDDSGPVGIAGMMGGLSTAVSDETTDVFFEAAWWPPAVMAGRARSYGMHTDASMRFERGVDPAGQARAVERATELLIAVSGGAAGPLDDQWHDDYMPERRSVTLTRRRLQKVLGTDIPATTVTAILAALGFEEEERSNDWSVIPPSYRFDIAMEDDLVEEVARIYGYERIPETTAIAQLPLTPVSEKQVDLERVANALVTRDYQEVVTYSFVDAELDEAVTGARSEIVLANPISSEMAVMRGSLWTGMLAIAAANVARQQDRVRLFEIGKSYHGTLEEPIEIVRVAGVALGAALPEQWSLKSQIVDFFDVKADIQALVGMTGASAEFAYVAARNAALQPGQAAHILRDGELVGVIGKLHPGIAKRFDLKREVVVFELDAQKTFRARVPVAEPVSRFPSIRRDIAIVVDNEVSATDLVRAIESTAPDLIRKVTIFDVYRGPGIEAGRKSVALGLILQETSRTLTDDDADTATAAAVQKLHQEFAATLRD